MNRHRPGALEVTLLEPGGVKHGLGGTLALWFGDDVGILV